MADSIREQIMASFAARLAAITVANGYQTDIGDNVVRARRSFLEEDLPAISVIDGAETFDRRGGSVLVSVPIEVHVIRNTTTHGSDCNKTLADVYQCVESWDFKTAGLIDSIEYQQGEPEYPEDGSDVLKVVSRFLLKYNLVKGDPYSQP